MIFILPCTRVRSQIVSCLAHLPRCIAVGVRFPFQIYRLILEYIRIDRIETTYRFAAVGQYLYLHPVSLIKAVSRCHLNRSARSRLVV